MYARIVPYGRAVGVRKPATVVGGVRISGAQDSLAKSCHARLLPPRSSSPFLFLVWARRQRAFTAYMAGYRPTATLCTLRLYVRVAASLYATRTTDATGGFIYASGRVNSVLSAQNHQGLVRFKKIIQIQRILFL